MAARKRREDDDPMPSGVLLYPGSPIFACDSPGYLDFFSDAHRNPYPVLLCDGTSVRWPAHWTRADAKRWRLHSGLEKPKPARTRQRDGAKR